MKKIILLIVTLGLLPLTVGSAARANGFQDNFKPLDDLLPPPTVERLASGAPGPGYWQQAVDYKIRATLDEDKRQITGTAAITYHNNSPHTLTYLWVQLDQNRNRPDSLYHLGKPGQTQDRYSYETMREILARPTFPGGHRIQAVTDADGTAIAHTVVDTMMRLDLSAPLGPGESKSFTIEWSFDIPDHKALGGRMGYEYFSDDGNAIFEIAEWYPRLAAYTDQQGWQNKPYIGRGEFSLEFGNFEVAITAPADLVVAATGVLQNSDEVLTATQRARLDEARAAARPVMIVTPEEAAAAEKNRTARKKTWVFKAENVRDFAFAASRKFIWDAMGVKQKNGPTVMAMSFYPKEAMPLWDKYSTHAIAHALEVYSRHTFPFPYPVMQSVNGPVFGMEYPMITFNGPRPEKDKDGQVTYSRRTKYALISVIIHEVGHNYFPMIVNSDERQWMWMDEGLNSFLQYIAEQEWEAKYPSRRGDPRTIVEYMGKGGQVPIMTMADSIEEIGHNAYSKPAAALTILRETILGRDLFDRAFREYAQRWKFKRATPADFFRTMEDVSGVNLTWFWRGWFYSTDHVDVSLERVARVRINTQNPDVEKAWEKTQEDKKPISLTQQRNQGIKYRVDRFPELKDFYTGRSEYTVTNQDRNDYQAALKDLKPEELALLKRTDILYLFDFKNIGGLITPIILEIEYIDGSRETTRLPVEIWRLNDKRVIKLLPLKKEVRSVTVDPHWETADTNTDNNHWPRRIDDIRLQLVPPKKDRNEMHDSKVPLRNEN